MGKKQSALWISISFATLALAGILGCGGSAVSANPTPTPTPTPPPAPQLAFNTASLSAPLNTQIPVSSFTITNCTAAGQISWNIVARTPGNEPETVTDAVARSLATLLESFQPDSAAIGMSRGKVGERVGS